MSHGGPLSISNFTWVSPESHRPHSPKTYLSAYISFPYYIPLDCILIHPLSHLEIWISWCPFPCHLHEISHTYANVFYFLNSFQSYFIRSIWTTKDASQVPVTYCLNYNDRLLTGLPNFILVTLKTILLSVTKGTYGVPFLTSSQVSQILKHKIWPHLLLWSNLVTIPSHTLY